MTRFFLRAISELSRNFACTRSLCHRLLLQASIGQVNGSGITLAADVTTMVKLHRTNGQGRGRSNVKFRQWGKLLKLTFFGAKMGSKFVGQHSALGSGYETTPSVVLPKVKIQMWLPWYGYSYRHRGPVDSECSD